METARRLRCTRVDYLRAGIWKARTRPANFEGIGAPALPWLRDAGKEYGLRTATEVATGEHVELALRHDIDLLWIGARTTVNPFSVQELADALRGTDLPVLIKNPTSPDMGLWFGALERVHRAGVKKLGVIHRGFASSAPSRFRNAPMWDLAIEFRRNFPHIPIVVDPSHISGRRELILEIAQEAMNLGLNGLMIESHANPDQAWSDAAQQVTPERLGEIMSRLHMREQVPSSAEFTAALERLRDEIDHIDHELISLLCSRMTRVERIAELKKSNNVATLQVERWRQLLEDRVLRAESLGLDSGYTRRLFELVHAESVRRQGELMDGISPEAEVSHEGRG